jgi:hypothetical protein
MRKMKLGGQPFEGNKYRLCEIVRKSDDDMEFTNATVNKQLIKYQ